MNRNEALSLLQQHVETQRVLRHSMAVEAAMRAYARKYGEDEERWGLIGLLHDIDFEKYPTEHPLRGPELLEGHGFDEDFINTILSHGSKENLPERNTKVSQCLHAVDEMASFIIAVALMRPTRLEGLSAKSVKKKMKDKAFARAVNREELTSSREALNEEFADHVKTIVEGLIAHEAFLQTQGVSLLD